MKPRTLEGIIDGMFEEVALKEVVECLCNKFSPEDLMKVLTELFDGKDLAKCIDKDSLKDVLEEHGFVVEREEQHDRERKDHKREGYEEGYEEGRHDGPKDG